MDSNQDGTNAFFNNDSELAKALADMGNESTLSGNSVQKEEKKEEPVSIVSETGLNKEPEQPQPIANVQTQSQGQDAVSASIPPSASAENSGNSDLNSIRTSAIAELRPLIDRVSIAPDEKFALLITLFNANHDQSLLDPAFTAAREIENEEQKAEALLEVIRGINSLSD